MDMHFAARYRIIGSTCGVLLVLLALLTWGLAPTIGFAQNNLGRGYDALSEGEMTNLATIALASFDQDEAARTTLVPREYNAPRRELILVERHQETKEVYASGTWQRRADAYVYNYKKDRLIHYIINLETGQIRRDARLRGVQLPLNNNEQSQAIDLLFGDPQMAQTLQQQYNAITGQTLQGPEQLNIDPFVFHAESMPEWLNGEAQLCGIHRCALLLVHTHENTLLDIIPIVDLSELRVVQDLNAVTATAANTRTTSTNPTWLPMVNTPNQ